MSKKILISLVCTLAVFALPAGAYVQAAGPTQTSGPTLSSSAADAAVANCKDVRGALSMSVGQIAAQGSGFVPVSDAAVTRNTGILVYKECVLRAMVDAQRKNEIAQLVEKSTTGFLTGNCVTDAAGEKTCGPMFPENLATDQQKWANLVVDQAINGTALNAITSAYQNDVKLAINRNYAQATQNPGASLACSNPNPAAVIAINNGTYGGPQDLYTVADPNCNAAALLYNGQSMVMGGVAADREIKLTRLGWNNGVYDVTTTDANGVSRVVTPGFIIAGSMQQQLGSGFRQLENANDIGQQIDWLFAGIGTQLLNSAVGGLQGLINSRFGQPSYLGTVVNGTGAEVQSGQVSATVDAVAAAYANETAYSAAKNATMSVIKQSITQVRGAENQCWNLIIPPVIAYAQQSGISQLNIATTTTASQAVIDSNMVALANGTQADVTASNATMAAINQVLAGVMGSSTSPTDAYNQIYALIASGALHTADQAQAAIQQTTAVQTALTAVVSDTVKHWGDDPLSATDPSSGWCNINNPAVITMWANKWKR